MAKVKFTAIVADMRNKLNGNVFSKNRSGAYLRTKVTPVNPQTVSQIAVRNRLTQLSQQFRTLGATSINAWNAATDNFLKTDIFGDKIRPSGINLFVRLNANILGGHGTVITTPPALTASPEINTVSATATAGTPTLSIVVSPGTVPANTAWIISATGQVSPGKSFVKNLYRNIKVVAAAATSPVNALSAYNAKFGTLVAGQKLFVSVQAIDLLTGLKSLAVSVEVIVGA